jgi:ankyrin repeat protein
MVAFLISRGADPEATDREGRTPADVASDDDVRAVVLESGEST